MDFLKLIPQLFYDLISKVLPGGYALLGITFALDSNVGFLIRDPFISITALSESAFFIGLFLFTLSYLLGQLIAPISNFYERKFVWSFVPEAYKVTAEKILKSDTTYTPAMRQFVRDELEIDEKIILSQSTSIYNELLYKSIFVWYDWLRVWYPDAGARSAKVRAEYRMHGALASSSILILFIHFIASWLYQFPYNSILITSTLSITILSTWGLVRTFRTFQWTVMNQYYVAKVGEKTNKEHSPLINN